MNSLDRMDAKAFQLREKLRAHVVYNHEKEMMNQTLHFKKEELPKFFSELSPRSRQNRWLTISSFQRQNPSKTATRKQRRPERAAQSQLAGDIRGPKCLSSHLDSRESSRMRTTFGQVCMTPNVKQTSPPGESLLSDPLVQVDTARQEEVNSEIKEESERELSLTPNETMYIDPISKQTGFPATSAYHKLGRAQIKSRTRAYTQSPAADLTTLQEQGNESRDVTPSPAVNLQSTVQPSTVLPHARQSNALKVKPLPTYRRNRPTLKSEHSHKSIVDALTTNPDEHLVTKYFCEPPRLSRTRYQNSRKPSPQISPRTAADSKRPVSIRPQAQFLTTQSIQLTCPKPHSPPKDGILKQQFSITKLSPAPFQPPKVWIQTAAAKTRVVNLSLPFDRLNERDLSLQSVLKRRFGNSINPFVARETDAMSTITKSKVQSEISEQPHTMQSDRSPIRLNLEIQQMPCERASESGCEVSSPAQSPVDEQRQEAVTTQILREHAQTADSFTSDENERIRENLILESRNWGLDEFKMPETNSPPQITNILITQKRQLPPSFGDINTAEFIEQNLRETQINETPITPFSGSNQEDDIRAKSPKQGKIGIPLYVKQTPPACAPVSRHRQQQLSDLRLRTKATWIRHEAGRLRALNPTQLPVVTQSLAVPPIQHFPTDFQRTMVCSPRKADLSFRQPGRRMVLEQSHQLRTGKSSQISAVRERLRFLATGADFREREQMRQSFGLP